MSVCVSQKSLFLYSKDLVVSHVYSYILYLKKLVISMFLDAFRIQRIWLFIMFLDTFHNQKCLETVKRQNPLKYSKNLVNSPVSRHCLLGKVGRLEGLKVGRLEGSSNEGVLSFPKVIIPDRAERRRREARPRDDDDPGYLAEVTMGEDGAPLQPLQVL